MNDKMLDRPQSVTYQDSKSTDPHKALENNDADMIEHSVEAPAPSAFAVERVAFAFFAVIALFVLLAPGAIALYSHFHHHSGDRMHESLEPSTQPQ